MTQLAVGVGCGLTAAGAVAGGADLLACYSTAIYRAAGLPSALAFLPYDDPNEIVARALPEVVAASRGTPVLAGIGAHDPRVRIHKLLDDIRSAGAVGVTNEPFIGIYEGALREQLEHAGLGYARELALARTATEEGMLCLGWAWNIDEAQKMAATGSSHVGLMLGITGTKAEPHHIQEAHDLLRDMNQAVRNENPEAITLIHGGFLDNAKAVRSALEHTGADGYLGGSALESKPVIEGMTRALREFKEKI